MVLHIELDRETDGRWIAEVRELRGVLAYGKTRHQARAKVLALALQVLADQINHGELPVSGRSRRVLKHLSFA
jgi:predicted RNase H-like HicB family nuclease